MFIYDGAALIPSSINHVAPVNGEAAKTERVCVMPQNATGKFIPKLGFITGRTTSKRKQSCYHLQ
jgi:hypothetical protein